MPIVIQELNHVMIRVRDLDASIRFYGKILGLARLPRPAFSFPGAWFALGRQELHLIGDAELADLPRAHHHFAVQVDDPESVRRDLLERGWSHLRGPAPRPDGAMQLFVNDPDGYVIEFMSAAPAN